MSDLLPRHTPRRLVPASVAILSPMTHEDPPSERENEEKATPRACDRFDEKCLREEFTFGSPAPLSLEIVALLTDGRFSGGSHGFIIGHITPEAAEGGPIGLVRDGDRITIDAAKCEIGVEVGDEELARRRAAWKAPAPKATSGVLAKYIRLVKPASEGCVTD